MTTAMNAATGHRPDAQMLAVRFPTPAAANRRLGGMSAAGRWAARIAEAGLAPAIVAPGAQPWPVETRDDFARAGVAPVFLDQLPPGLQALDGRYLPDAAALRAAADGQPPDPLAAIDLADERAALRRIVRVTAKPSDGVVSRRLNRPISQRITMFLLRYASGVRPSHVTAFVALVGVAMIASLLFGGAAGLVAGGVLFHVASVLDGVDGELARAGYRSSAAGRALDTRVDMLTNVGYIFCIAVALTRLYGGSQAVVGGLAVLLALTGLAIVAWLARRMGLHGSLDVLKPYYRERFPGGWQYWVTELLVMTTSRDFFAFAFGVVIVIGFGWMVSWLLLAFILAWLTAVVCAVPGVLRQAELRGISASRPSRTPIAARPAARG